MSEITTTTTKVDEMLEKFVDATANEVYHEGRMVTRETEDSVQLVAYGNRVYAEVDKGANVVSIYEGHEDAGPTNKRRLNRLKEIAEERSVAYSVVRVSPIIGAEATANEPTKYIKNYVGSFKNMSPVESDAVSDVIERSREGARRLLE